MAESLSFRPGPIESFSSDHGLYQQERKSLKGSCLGRLWCVIFERQSNVFFNQRGEGEPLISSSGFDCQSYVHLSPDKKEIKGYSALVMELVKKVMAVVSKIFSFIYLPRFAEKETLFKERVSSGEVKSPRGMRYEDLTAQEEKLRNQIIEENRHYAAYMNDGPLDGKHCFERGFQVAFSDDEECIFLKYQERHVVSFDKGVADGGVESAATGRVPLDIDRKNVGFVKEFIQEVKKIGFQVDSQGHFYDAKTGSIFTLIFDPGRGELDVCFMGIGSEKIIESLSSNQRRSLLWGSIKAAAVNVVGGCPAALTQAMDVGRLLKEKTNGSRMTPVVVGHSHGGALAQAAAIGNGLRGVVFNAEPLGVGIKRYIDNKIGKVSRTKNSNQLIAFSSTGDWLSDGAIAGICRFGRDRGWPVPTVLGKGYRLPGVEGNWFVKHNDYLSGFNILRDQGILS